jgi:hypothetical protein
MACTINKERIRFNYPWLGRLAPESSKAGKLAVRGQINDVQIKEYDMKRICAGCFIAVLLAYVVLLNVGCSTYPTAAEVGAARGAAVGAIAGQAIGRDTKSTLIGVGVGAVGGAVLNDQRARNRGY